MNRERADYPLAEEVNAHREQISMQAEAWLNTGYRAFGIWGDDLIACWPASAWHEMSRLEDADLTLYAPITVEEQIIGKVGVLGRSEIPIGEVHLDAEANLISQMLTMKARFEQAATELVVQARLRTEMDMAAKIQLQLLPQQFPQVNGLDIYAHSNPAEQVGGDFYDFSAYKDRPFVFAIGDISGKGLPAALFMTMTRIVLHTTARSLPSVDPKAILTRVNEDLYEDFSEVGMFTTVFAGCYDTRSAQLSYANAGHSPVIYCPKGGPAVLLEADAPMLGILPTCTCTNHVLPFRTDDVLVAATDGLNESFNADGEMFGYERLLKTVETLAHLPSSQIGSELLRTINQFTRGYVQSDDQTFIILKGVAYSQTANDTSEQAV
jgi:sigma-B regulation protein RsbU (phosphoserine phosphatase)